MYIHTKIVLFSSPPSLPEAVSPPIAVSVSEMMFDSCGRVEGGSSGRPYRHAFQEEKRF